MAASEYHCQVKQVEWITPTVFEIEFVSTEPTHFKAGQFLSIVVPASSLSPKDVRRAYSIASPPEAESITLCIKKVENGPGSTYLAELKSGAPLKMFSPYGSFTFKSLKTRRAAFIATGTGIAPFRSMVLSKEFAENRPIETTLLLGVREENEVLYHSLFSSIPAFKYQVAVSRPGVNWNGFKGRVTDLLRSFEKEYAWLDTDFYLCGNSGMIDEVKSILALHGVPKTAIHQEIYYKDPK